MIKTIVKRCLLYILIVVLMTDSIELVAEASETNTTEYEIYIVLATSNLRAEPSKEGRWIATIPYDAYVVLLDMTDTDFRLVSYNGVEGYIYHGCIKKLEGTELQKAIIELGLEGTDSSADFLSAKPSIVSEYQNGNRKIELLQKPNSQLAVTQDDEDVMEENVLQEDTDESVVVEETADSDLPDSIYAEENNGHCSVRVQDIAAAISENQSDSALPVDKDNLKYLQACAMSDSATSKREQRQEQLDASLNFTNDKASNNVTNALSDMENRENAYADTAENLSQDVMAQIESDYVEMDSSEIQIKDEADADSQILYGHTGAVFVGLQNKADEEEKTYEQAKIRANAVLRTLPSANSKKKLTVPKNATVTIIDDGENGYLHVLYEQEEGYIIAKVTEKDGTRTYASGILDTIVTEEKRIVTSPILASRHRNLSLSSKGVLNYIQQEENITVQTQELTATTETASASTLTNNDIDYQIRTRANMRLTPSQAGDWVTTLPTGANVNLLGDTSNGYTLVQYNGIQGYVLESVVVDSVDFSTMSSEGAALFSLTAYCSCAKCCGSYSPEVTGRESHTATGTVPVQGRTIAVDPKVIPYGSVVHIEGMGDYVAEDCGGGVKGNHIDVYFDSHEEAVQFGRQKRYVSIN